MTTVTIYKSPDGSYTGIEASGHAMYAEAGSDIVCAAVSMLTINTLNSIDRFTSDHVTVTQDETRGFMEARFSGDGDAGVSPETTLLMRSYEMGITALAGQYDNVRLRIQERG